MNEFLENLIKEEQQRQQDTINLIASENFTSRAVRQAVGSVFMHKYSEGKVGKRYYEGNEIVDKLESDTTDKLKQFMLSNDPDEIDNWHVNVQIPTGSIANLVVYRSVLNPGDTILSMFLPDGGHLSHGWSFDKDQQDEGLVHFSGKNKSTFVSQVYNVVQYKTAPDSNLIDYEKLSEIAKQVKPKIIITGGTAYCREINYEKIAAVCKKVRAMYLADIAHEAGLIGAGAMKSPFKYADFVTFTTHKTLRGPRGAVVMCRAEFAEKVDKSVMPGLLGGPFNHSIAGLHQALDEANTVEFREYAQQVVRNAQKLAEQLIMFGFNLVSGGTDKHLLVVNLENKNINGTKLSEALAKIGIISNKSTVPYEKGSPMNPSGVRFGTPFVTTRGMKEIEMIQIAELVNEVTEAIRRDQFNELLVEDLRLKVLNLTKKFPLDI